MTTSVESTRRKEILVALRKAVIKAVAKEDPWKDTPLLSEKAERIRRHMYDPITESWYTDETIAKIEKKPFTHGAMRICFRMKKRAQPPRSASNHSFHKFGWANHANNYVAKAYASEDGSIDCSEDAKNAVRSDILLQYEAEHWASLFNHSGVATKIHFIRAYAIELIDRPGQPWLAVERFIEGTDSYGAGFVKHNTNSGFVDDELHRVTPQVFSAFSFYKSEGNRLVADIQGVGDLYTDPQVLSSDYRFGDGDLGPRGMALFFKSFRHCGMSDGLGIPIFPLSKNEIKTQLKYDEDELTLSDDELSYQSHDGPLDRFQRLDLNRIRRKSVLSPHPLQSGKGRDSKRDTQKRSNLSRRNEISETFRKSMKVNSRLSILKRTKSDVDEVSMCIIRAKQDVEYTQKDFHRKESGQLKERHFKKKESFHKSAVVRSVQPPMMITESLKDNLAKVHYQLAVLHGMCRFPEVVPNHGEEGAPDHDAFSVLFHLSHAAALKSPSACLALARVQANLETSISELLKDIVPVDFDSAKELLYRAMLSHQKPTAPKVAAGCLLFQMLHDAKVVREQSELVKGIEGDFETEMYHGESVSYQELDRVLTTTLELFDIMDKEEAEGKRHREAKGKIITYSVHVGDRVEANYLMEGSFYAATVESIEGDSITVRYDDDDSTEALPRDQVRLLIPPTATQTSNGNPLSDEEAFGEDQVGDHHLVYTQYELLGELASLNECQGNSAVACDLYQRAADMAMNDGKMKKATEWSLKAAELEE